VPSLFTALDSGRLKGKAPAEFEASTRIFIYLHRNQFSTGILFMPRSALFVSLLKITLIAISHFYYAQ